jgi:O-antigen ligase
MSERSLEQAVVKEAVRAPRLGQIADGLATAVAVSLPWSTSATAVLIVLWLIALVPTLDVGSVRRELLSAAGGLPVLLWVLAAVGMLWADVSWSERVAGLSGFHKLLCIPLLLAQFRRSTQARWAIIGFLASSAVLLVVSWALVLTPGLTWRGKVSPGVPVKNYIMQSAIFVICAFGLLGQAVELWHRRALLFLVLVLLAAVFVANIFYVETARTTLVVAAVMLVLFGSRQFGWKGALGAALIGAMLTGAVWTSSPYLRQRVSVAVKELQMYDVGDVNNPTGLRLEYWKKSLVFIAEAPVIGHGTGTIPMLFRRNATAETAPALITTNPHSQVLAVAIELGFVGVAALLAMWLAHLALFRDKTLAAWFGLLVVTYNVVSSLFNSHLFDFSQGWLYVFGVGLAGGMVLRAADGAAKAEEKT